MLRKVERQRTVREGPGHFAIVASQYNARYVDALVRNAGSELARAGVRGRQLKVVRVPGAFEIPVVAATLARSHAPRLSAVLCLGVILQGETEHARHLGDAVSWALAHLQLVHQIPVIHGVYLFNNEEQARVRCLDRTHNRGVELARTALAMARVMRTL
jgi:6,7-dimethyl-8-ribityllumazine synthase